MNLQSARGRKQYYCVHKLCDGFHFKEDVLRFGNGALATGRHIAF